MIEKTGAEPLYLPPNPPGLNPVEKNRDLGTQWWYKIKRSET
jgi:transposase